MSAETESRGHRTGRAKPWLIVVFIMQRLGDWAVFYGTMHPQFPQPILRGVAAAMLIWTSALLVGVWQRYRWARYLLASLGWLYAFGLIFAALQFWNSLSFPSLDPRLAPFAGALCYLAANVILVRTRHIRHFANR